MWWRGFLVRRMPNGSRAPSCPSLTWCRWARAWPFIVYRSGACFPPRKRRLLSIPLPTCQQHIHSIPSKPNTRSLLQLDNLPKSAALPVGTLNEAKRRLQYGVNSDIHPDKDWSQFEYLYFTESDQILMIRISKEILDHIDAYPRRMLLPHRLMPYPDNVLTVVHDRKIDKEWRRREKNGDWMKQSCCLVRQNCLSRLSSLFHTSHNTRVHVYVDLHTI